MHNVRLLERKVNDLRESLMYVRDKVDRCMPGTPERAMILNHVDGALAESVLRELHSEKP